MFWRSLQRRVHCVKSKVEEKGVFLLFVDIRHSFACESIGKVFFFFNSLGAPNNVADDGFAIGVGVCTAKKTKVFIKAPVDWVEFFSATEMPFAHHACFIPCIFK